MLQYGLAHLHPCICITRSRCSRVALTKGITLSPAKSRVGNSGFVARSRSAMNFCTPRAMVAMKTIPKSQGHNNSIIGTSLFVFVFVFVWVLVSKLPYIAFGVPAPIRASGFLHFSWTAATSTQTHIIQI